MRRAFIRATGLLTALSVPLLAGEPPVVTRQPVSQRVMAGHSTRLVGGSADTHATFEWELAGVGFDGATTPQRLVRHALPGNSGRLQLIARNSDAANDAPAVGETASQIARLSVVMPPQSPGIVDLDFADPGLADGAVRALAAMPDGGVLAVGDFTSADGQAAGRVIRLRADGIPDPSFVSNPAADGRVRTVVAHRDGWVVGGDFASYQGQPRSRLVRLLADGRLDPGFVPPVVASTVRVLAVQKIGLTERVLVGLSAAPWLLRLQPDGRPDDAFSAAVAAAGLNGRINALAVQPDGGIVLGGAFFTENGWPFLRIGRLLSDGRADNAGFVHGVGTGADLEVMALALAPDGRIILGGRFTTVHGQSRFYLARLLTTGQLDVGFNPSPNDGVNALAVRPDGQVYAAGDFSRIDGVSVRTVARLAPNGARDPAWQPAGFDGRGLALALGSDGRVFLGGDFAQPHSLLAALRGAIPAAPPRVMAVEDPQHLEAGAGATLVVAAEASPDTTFLWRRNGLALGVTQTGEWVIPRVGTDDAGTYSVDLANPLGSTTAGPFSVRVSSRSPGARPLWRGLAAHLPSSLPNQGVLETPISLPALTAAEIQVTLAVEHADTNDLVIDLIAPDGRSVRLVDPDQPTTIRRGRNFDFTVFADGAPDRINDAAAPYVGTFRPSADLPALSSLAGSQPAGDWRLRIQDLREDENTGTLRFVALDVLGPQPVMTRAFFQRAAPPSDHPDVAWQAVRREITVRHWQPAAGSALVYDLGLRLSQWVPLPPDSLRLLRFEDDQSAASTLRLPDDAGISECFLRVRWP